MSLKLYMHPLASFCQKVLVALYENGTPFEAVVVDLQDVAQRDRLKELWPMAKFPVLRDDDRIQVVVESSIIIEYLQQHYPGPVTMLPAEGDAALEVRFKDRFFDLYVEEPMQKIVTDKLRPAGASDAHGVKEARGVLRTAYGVIDHLMARRTWAAGDNFTMVDCGAAPALFYANKVEPVDADKWPNAAAYLERLMARPSWLRVLEEAQPYLKDFPG